MILIRCQDTLTLISLFISSCLNPIRGDLVDKTLVVWVAPSNLSQRGGSALTIDDGRDHFDAIVFGELAPARWMAGSDYWKRSIRYQEAVTKEVATSEEMVQVSIVYSGQQVKTYRNGALIEQHVFSGEPQAFGAPSRVNFGKRHRQAMDGAFFGGAIDDARIYDRPLTETEIKDLKPNVKSSLKPWAWWTFNQTDGKEQTGRFPISKVLGGAKIENGKLILDGRSGEFMAESDRKVIFKPETPTRPKVVPSNWLNFHLAHPGPTAAMPGDPNCAFYIKGRYHLHYIYANSDGFAFAHVSSKDLIHWKWHPTTLTPSTTGHGMFSGTGFMTKEGRPAIIYHGQGSGRNQISIALDDNLEKWSKPVALEPLIQPIQDGTKIANWDPDAWIDGIQYYALSGGSPGSGKPPTLFRSSDLKRWDYLDLFMTKDMPDVRPDEDVSCPNFFKIGNKHMLLCISHNLGCRYYLGKWENEKFTPDFHARMNWHGWDYFAPESLLTADGRRVMWAWCNFGTPQTGIQSLPRELSLSPEGELRIKPLRELKQLRMNPTNDQSITVRSNSRHVIKGASGNSLECQVEFAPTKSKSFGVDVHCNKDGSQGFPIRISPERKALELGKMSVPFELKPGESVNLHIFIDQNMIEVFINDRQAAVASHVTGLGNTGIQIVTESEECFVRNVSAWKLKSIYQ